MVGWVFVAYRSEHATLEESVEARQLSDAAQAVIQAKREKARKNKQRKNERKLGHVEAGEASVDANAQAPNTSQSLHEANEQGQGEVVQVCSYTCVLLKQCDILLLGLSVVTFGPTLQGRLSMPKQMITLGTVLGTP